MGYYIQGPTFDKKVFIDSKLKAAGKAGIGTAVNEKGVITATEAIARGDILCCEVDNLMFTACAIAYDDRERDAFMVNCGRRKEWFTIPRADLTHVVDAEFAGEIEELLNRK